MSDRINNNSSNIDITSLMTNVELRNDKDFRGFTGSEHTVISNQNKLETIKEDITEISNRIDEVFSTTDVKTGKVNNVKAKVLTSLLKTLITGDKPSTTVSFDGLEGRDLKDAKKLYGQLCAKMAIAMVLQIQKLITYISRLMKTRLLNLLKMRMASSISLLKTTQMKMTKNIFKQK